MFQGRIQNCVGASRAHVMNFISGRATHAEEFINFVEVRRLEPKLCFNVEKEKLNGKKASCSTLGKGWGGQSPIARPT